MATLQVGNPVNVTAKGGTGINGGNNVGGGFALTAGPPTIDNMKARLTTLSATTYTAQRLTDMSYNDMVYALRVLDHPTSI